MARPYSLVEMFKAKKSYALKFMSIVDLVSILPAYIVWISKAFTTHGNVFPSDAVMIIRVLRILMIFKYEPVAYISKVLK